MSDNFAWVIEAPGPRYLSVRRLGGIGGMHDFVWSSEHQQAIRFMSEQQADLTMMAIRDMDRRINGFDKGLFAFEVNLGNARAVEHGWLAAAG